MGIFTRKLNEEQFKETIRALQELERIKTPDSFEYHLMTKIQNHDFTTSSPEEKSFRFAWVLPPAAAVVLTSIVLVFILVDQSPEAENLLISPPELRQEYQTVQVTRREPIEYVAKETSESVEQSYFMEPEGLNNSQGFGKNVKVVLQENDVIIRKKSDFPFNETANVDLDNYIDGPGGSSVSKSNARLVRENTDYPVFDFDGFYIREEIDRNMRKKHQNRIDSLRNTRLRK